MNLHERSLSVLACKYVDEVVIGSPMVISRDVVTTFNISVVVRGSVSETSSVRQLDAVSVRDGWKGRCARGRRVRNGVWKG